MATTTAPHSEPDSLIALRGGFTVRRSVWTWMVSASWRLQFDVLTGDRLAVRPRSAMTAADEAFIRDHKAELLACVVYVDRMPSC